MTYEITSNFDNSFYLLSNNIFLIVLHYAAMHLCKRLCDFIWCSYENFKLSMIRYSYLSNKFLDAENIKNLLLRLLQS